MLIEGEMQRVCVFLGFFSLYHANITLDFAELACSYSSEEEL